MQTMNISLPDPMKQYVDEQVTVGGYSSASEYVCELVRRDQKRQAKEILEQTLLAAMNDGEALEANDEWWVTSAGRHKDLIKSGPSKEVLKWA